MQETDFIKQNKDKWQEFEEVLKSTNKDPERITDLFIETTDDLSYSRTFYPNRSVRVYLNGISQQVYQAIYKNKKREKHAFRNFWFIDLPIAMWHSRKALLWSFLLFATGITIGIVSSIYYPDFARIILGQSYIDMTEANIAHGDPMAVYKDQEPLIMFFKIAWNNIRIAYGTFVLGILFGIGTIYVVFYNAIMVGTFIYFFIERGLFKESFLAIMLHGTLELSMIVVAGCAGFALARGLIFPGTFTRGQALIHSARNGIKILIGVTLLLIYAAIIESFATRYSDMPDVIRGLIILFSLTIVVGYFVLYPIYLHTKGKIPDLENDETPAKPDKTYHLHTIKTQGKIFTETFNLFSSNARQIGIWSLLLASIITLAFLLFTSGKMHEVFEYDGFELSSALFGFFYVWNSFHYHLNFTKFPFAYVLYVLAFSGYALLLFKRTMKIVGIKSSVKSIDVLNIVCLSAITAIPLLFNPVLSFFTMPFIFPICLLWMFLSMKEKTFFLTNSRKLFSLIKGNVTKIIGTFLSMLAIQWIVMFLLSTQLVDLAIQFIQTNVPRNAYLSEEFYAIMFTFFLFYVFTFIISLSIFSTTLLYYSILEINEAKSLLSAIDKVGFKKRAYGLEQES